MEVIPYDIMANTFMVIFAALGVFLTIYNVIKAAKELRKPHNEHMAQVSDHDSAIARNTSKLSEIQNELYMILDGHILVLEHLITGNHIPALKDHKDIVMRYLITHRGHSDDKAE